MAQKEVKVKVATDVEMERVEALEKKVQALKLQRIHQKIDMDSSALDAANKKIQSLEIFLDTVKSGAQLPITVNDEQITAAEAELQQLKEQTIALEMSVETGKLEAAKAEVEELDGKEIHIDMQTSMQNVSQGIAQAKEVLAGLADNVNEVQQAGMQSEQNLGFLEMNIGAEKARDTMQQINDIVASMPGDDNTMRSVLSTAQALGNNLNADEMKSATATMADYMQGSATMGKQAIESQQDIMKYLLDGNTAELERGSIVSSQVDKLKEATTFQERQKAMQEVLNQLGYGGIANLDTMVNKQAEWEGMMYNSKDALSSMWLTAEKGAMDYIIKLNDATGGILGMGIAAGQMAAGPLVDMLAGLGQMATGLKAIKDLGIVSSLGKIGSAFSSLWGVIIANPIILVVVAIVALIAAFIWAYQNVDWFREMVDNAWASIQGFAGWLTGTFTGAITSVGDAFNNAGQMLQDAFTGAVEYVQGILQGLYDYIMTLGGLLPEGVNITGNQIVDSILAVMMFIATLPMQIGMIFMNIIASTLGFGNNFTQTMISTAVSTVTGFINQIVRLPSEIGNQLNSAISHAVSFAGNFINTIVNSASNAVNGFVSTIAQMPQRLGEELNKMIQQALDFAARLPQIIGEAAVNMVGSWVGGSGEQSPGFMYDAFYGEIDEMDKIGVDFSNSLPTTIGEAAENMVDSFNPSLSNGTLNESFANGSVGGTTLVMNFNDQVIVDDDERMEKFANYTIRKMNFDNRTAGRTV